MSSCLPSPEGSRFCTEKSGAGLCGPGAPLYRRTAWYCTVHTAASRVTNTSSSSFPPPSKSGQTSQKIKYPHASREIFALDVDC